MRDVRKRLVKVGAPVPRLGDHHEVVVGARVERVECALLGTHRCVARKLPALLERIDHAARAGRAKERRTQVLQHAVGRVKCIETRNPAVPRAALEQKPRRDARPGADLGNTQRTRRLGRVEDRVDDFHRVYVSASHTRRARAVI